MIKNKSNIDIIFSLLLFTSGFTATSIYNLNDVSFSLPFVIGILFIIFELKNIILKKHNMNLKKINLFLIFFIINSFFSILFSKFITSNFKITFQSGVYDYYF
ncbi:MAG: hypothetical protein ACRDDH_18915, partial [Cetobacterium sp.]|uniref:hypothetical protein n=1 Tax=Cetobacterium sp. TaxID=2071632 RepID=UPI003EE4F81C